MSTSEPPVVTTASEPAAAVAPVAGRVPWRRRAAMTGALLALATVAFSVGSYSLTTQPFDVTGMQRGGLVLLLAIAFDVVTVRVVSLRRQVSVRPFANMSSVWIFAAAVVLPAGQATVTIALLGVAQWLIRPRASRGRLYPRLATWTAAVVAAQCAAAALGPQDAGHAMLTLRVIAALLVFLLVDTTLLFGIRSVAIGAASLRTMFGSAEDLGLEICTLCLGGVAALCLLHGTWLVLLVLPPMVLLQRSALLKQLEEAATTDTKTGLLNAGTWQQVGEREVLRAERESSRLAVLILDLDFFKSVNDRHGHLTGDAALVDVARCLLRELRPYDVVGRFGGEEFVALLPGVGADGAVAAAERIRTRIAALTVTPVSRPADPTEPAQTLSASIGVAVFPQHGADLSALLHEADAALYTAKRNGRDQVVVAGAPGPDPRPAPAL